MKTIYALVSIYKENDNNDQYVMAISYSKELLENMIQNIPSSKLEYCNYIIKENIDIYSIHLLPKNSKDIFISKIYSLDPSNININNLYAFNKITTSTFENVLLDITGFDINEVRTFNIFKNDVSDNNILFDIFYDECIMNA